MSSSLLRPRSPTSELVDARDRPSQPSAEPSAAPTQRLNDAMVRTMDFLNPTDQLALLSADAELAKAVAVLVALAFANLVRASETVEDGGFKCVRRVFWFFVIQDPHAWECASAKMLSNLAEFDVVLKEAIAATLRHVLVEAMGDKREVYVLLERGDPFIGWIANVFGFQFPATASWNSPVPSPEPCCGLVRIDDSRSVRFLRLAYSHSRISDDGDCREVQCSPEPSVYAACQHGHTDCFRVLRHLGARDDEFIVNHVNAFSFVASTGNEDFCRFLLARGASLQDQKGTCLALSAAVASGHEHIVRFLISAGAKATNAHLGTAVSRSDEAESMIRLLIENGADGNGRLDGRFWHGATPLHLASGALRDVNTQLLVSLGANANARDLNGATPLMKALRTSGASKEYGESVDAFQKRCAAFELRRRNVVVCLCTAGADATLSDNQGETAVSLAAGANMEELLRYFHSIGVDVTAAGGNGITPFFIAASKGYVSLAQFLHGCGADVNGTSRDGTPLVAAVTNGHDAMVKYLHSVGADFTKHAPGSSLLQIATRHKHAKIASFIKKVTKKK